MQISGLEPTHDTMVERLLGHWYDAHDAGLKEEGARWYRESRRTARRLAKRGGVSLATAAGVIAALSPQMQWPVTVRIAEQVLTYGEPQEGTLPLSALRATRIYNGERPLRVLGGPKTRAFYRAMMGDENAAVIDTWMLVAVGWHRTTCSARQYERVAAALRESATLAGEGTATFQAVVWTQVRGGGE